jgi:GNAT superfamily N-acetyltransferase
MPRLVWTALGRYLAGRYHRSTRRYLHWMVLRGWRETPKAPPDAAHFHFNVLPGGRGNGGAREMVERFLDRLRSRNVKRVYGQMTVQPHRRGPAVFERLGWRVTDYRPLSKFNDVDDGIYRVATIVRDL